MVYNVYEDCSRRSNSMMKTRNSDYGGDGPRGTSPQLAINASSDTDKQHAGVITNDERVAIQYFNLDTNRRNEDSQTSSPSICEYVRTYILPLHHYQIRKILGTSPPGRDILQYFLLIISSTTAYLIWRFFIFLSLIWWSVIPSSILECHAFGFCYLCNESGMCWC